MRREEILLYSTGNLDTADFRMVNMICGCHLSPFTSLLKTRMSHGESRLLTKQGATVQTMNAWTRLVGFNQ